MLTNQSVSLALELTCCKHPKSHLCRNAVIFRQCWNASSSLWCFNETGSTLFYGIFWPFPLAFWHSNSSYAVFQVFEIAQMIICPGNSNPSVAHLRQGLNTCACWHDLLRLIYVKLYIAHFQNSLSNHAVSIKLEMFLIKCILGFMIRIHGPHTE